MNNLTKKKIITLSVINLLFAILFIKLKLIFSDIIHFEEFNYGSLIVFGIINYLFFTKKNNLKNHAKFFIPVSLVIAFLFAIVYLLYRIFFMGYTEGYLMNLFFISLPIATAELTFIFFVGTLLGAALREIFDRVKIIIYKKAA